MSPDQSLQSLFPREQWQETRILLAVSGGADSVALLMAMRQTSPSQYVQAAHVNHGWRGSESDEDERFVRELCQTYHIPLHVHRCPPPTTAASPQSSIASDQPRKGATEESARQLRYQFLTQTAYRIGARYVLTAHTGSDRVETLLHNLFRGTGLAGVSGPALMRPLDEELVLVRPLLACTRDEVEAYLAGLKQPFRTDSSNADLKYRRNFLRHKLLPLLREQYGPRVDERLFAFSEMAEEAVRFHRELAEEHLDRGQSLWRTEGAQWRQAWTDGASSPLAFPREHKLPVAWTIAFQALQIGWQRHGWPLQDMTRGHWRQLRQAWSDTEQPVQPAIRLAQLPGNLHLHALPDWLIVDAAMQQPAEH
jgi:tRNA(Ile)-lysidine synthase